MMYICKVKRNNHIIVRARIGFYCKHPKTEVKNFSPVFILWKSSSAISGCAFFKLMKRPSRFKKEDTSFLSFLLSRIKGFLPLTIRSGLYLYNGQYPLSTAYRHSSNISVKPSGRTCCWMHGAYATIKLGPL